MAHIIGRKEDGPRGDEDLPVSQRDEFENIILLCPTCHTLIDKNPELYPVAVIKEWKRNHEDSIKGLFIAPQFTTRQEARKYVYPILAENKTVFDLYGPYSQNAIDNQMSTELEWERLAIQKIIPNNRKLELAVSHNTGLLTDEEYGLFIRFKLHREGFEYNKLSGDVNAVVPTFPSGFENIYL